MPTSADVPTPTTDDSVVQSKDNNNRTGDNDDEGEDNPPDPDANTVDKSNGEGTVLCELNSGTFGWVFACLCDAL